MLFWSVTFSWSMDSRDHRLPDPVYIPKNKNTEFNCCCMMDMYKITMIFINVYNLP